MVSVSLAIFQETAGIINEIWVATIADIKMSKIIDDNKDEHFLYERLALHFLSIEFLY